MRVTPTIDVDDPIKSHHDVPATNEAIKHLLADGTPDWIKFPEEYKSFAKECYARDRQISEEMAAEYKLEDQDVLTNAAARLVNPMRTRDFIQKLRSAGIKCFTIDNGFPKQCVALWCLPPKQTQKARYICYLQTPAMYEWSLLKIDEYGKPWGEDYRGWRTVLVQLIKKEILTEYQAHELFGYPSQNSVFNRYHCTLWEIRNERKYTRDEIVSNDH